MSTVFRIIVSLLFLLASVPSSIRTESATTLPLVINTWDFLLANKAAWNKLSLDGGSYIDAVIAGCSACEDLQCDGTVGYGGSPDEHGESSLDAMIMDGRTMNVGAVAALRSIREASAVARHVLDNTEHSLLVGEQAADFAEQMGFRRKSLVTPQSASIWNKWHAADCQPNFWRNVQPDPRQHCGPYEPLSANDIGEHYGRASAASRSVDDDRSKHRFGRRHHDTIGMVVIDRSGNVAAGTSTNGANHKIPGRVGDSPIVGSGAYADNAVGAAAATGDGDILMRFLPSLLAVESMRNNVAPAEAARAALERIRPYYPNFVGALIAANKDGVYGAACHGMARFPYSVYNASGNVPMLMHVECFT